MPFVLAWLCNCRRHQTCSSWKEQWKLFSSTSNTCVYLWVSHFYFSCVYSQERMFNSPSWPPWHVWFVVSSAKYYNKSRNEIIHCWLVEVFLVFLASIVSKSGKWKHFKKLTILALCMNNCRERRISLRYKRCS